MPSLKKKMSFKRNHFKNRSVRKLSQKKHRPRRIQSKIRNRQSGGATNLVKCKILSLSYNQLRMELIHSIKKLINSHTVKIVNHTIYKNIYTYEYKINNTETQELNNTETQDLNRLKDLGECLWYTIKGYRVSEATALFFLYNRVFNADYFIHNICLIALHYLQNNDNLDSLTTDSARLKKWIDSNLQWGSLELFVITYLLPNYKGEVNKTCKTNINEINLKLNDIYNLLYNGFNTYFKNDEKFFVDIILDRANPTDIWGIVLHDSEYAQEQDAKTGSVFVNEVVPDSPAAKSGLQPGDQIMSIDDHSVYDLVGKVTTQFAQKLKNKIMLRVKRI